MLWIFGTFQQMLFDNWNKIASIHLFYRHIILHTDNVALHLCLVLNFFYSFNCLFIRNFVNKLGFPFILLCNVCGRCFVPGSWKADALQYLAKDPLEASPFTLRFIHNDYMELMIFSLRLNAFLVVFYFSVVVVV